MAVRRAIVTAAIGERFERMAALTVPTQRAYAQRIGAEHVLVDSLPDGITAKTSHWAKFRIAEMLEEAFDEVLWLDSDIAVSPAAPSIFGEAGGRLAAYPEGDVVDRIEPFREYYRRLRGVELRRSWTSYFNSGVLVVPRTARKIMSRPEQDEVDATMKMREENPGRFFFDQNLINARIAESGIDVVRLSYRWNLMHVPAEFMGVKWEDRAKSGHMVHYAGLMKYLGEKALDLVREDLGKWGVANV